jgi:adenine phosphoribosyltransferase
MNLIEKLNQPIRDVPNFPKEGIMFKDITPILKDAKLCDEIVDEFALRVKAFKIDAIVGIESRGFFFGFMLANKLNVPFIPLRKAGKLPYATDSYEYNLEYGTAKIEIHKDAIEEGWNVMIHDDLLATGGTAIAAAELVKKQKGKIACFTFLVELDFLNAKSKLNSYSENVISILNY